MLVQRILRLQHKVPLVRKTKELAFDPLQLQSCKGSETHCHRAPKVQVVVSDQHRRRPILSETCGIPPVKGIFQITSFRPISTEERSS